MKNRAEILTDSPAEAARFFGLAPLAARAGGRAEEAYPPSVLAGFFGAAGKAVRCLLPGVRLPDRYGPIILQRDARRSNLDVITQLQRCNAPLPEGLVCAAVAGSGFLGRFDRSWTCLPGNLHALFLLAPALPLARAGAAFSILPAAACVEAIETLAFGAPGAGGADRKTPAIKWINDIYAGGCKVGGILVRQTYRDPLVEAVVLGIGVNVLAAPRLSPDPFVPAAGCLAKVFPERPWTPGSLLVLLAERIDAHYRRLLEAGPGPLLDVYRERSCVAGRNVRVYQDGHGFEENGAAPRRLLARGRVLAIHDDLALEISNCPRPVASGRLAFEEDCAEAR